MQNFLYLLQSLFPVFLLWNYNFQFQKISQIFHLIHTGCNPSQHIFLPFFYDCGRNFIKAKCFKNTGTGLRQLPLHKTSCKIAGSRLNSGFFIAKTCQFFEKYLLYVLCGVVLYGIILV